MSDIKWPDNGMHHDVDSAVHSSLAYACQAAQKSEHLCGEANVACAQCALHNTANFMAYLKQVEARHE